MDASQEASLEADTPATTVRRGEKRRASVDNAASHAKRVPNLHTPVRDSILGSSSGLAGQTAASSVPPSWEPVNRHVSSTATPNSESRSGSYAQLAAEVLKKETAGLSSYEIFSVIKNNYPGRDPAKLRGAVSAALSANAKGDARIFEKRLSEGPGNRKFIWFLRNNDVDSASQPVDVCSDNGHTIHGFENATAVSAPCEPSESDTSRYAVASTPPLSGVTILNEAITSQRPHDTAQSSLDGTLTTSTPQHPEPQQSERNVLSATDTPLPLVRELNLVAQRDQEMIGHPAAPLVPDEPDQPPLEEHNAVTAEAPLEAVAQAVRDSPIFRELAPTRTLERHLAAMVGMHLKQVCDRFQQQTEEMRKHFSLDHIDEALMGNENVDIGPEALLHTFRRSAELDTPLSPSPSDASGAYQAIDILERARAFEIQTTMIIPFYEVIRTRLNATLHCLEASVDLLNATKETLTEYQAQAAASINSSRQSLEAYINAG